MLQDFLSAVGALFLAALVFRVLSWVKLNFFAGGNVKRYLKAGKWAVVTGASDGIGKAFAVELARNGFNIALISRSKDKLDAAAEECKKFNVEARSWEFDFSRASSLDYTKLAHDIQALEVGVLVNNVGINYDYPQFFDETDIADDLKILKVNCESQLQMTKMVLPGMKKRNRGAIVNLGSFSARAHAGLLTTYAATKAFNNEFSLALSTELSRTGIDVIGITPNMVVSNMSKVKRETFMIVNPRALARQTLSKLGATQSDAGHWHHSLIENVFLCLPESIRRKQVFGSMITLKKKAEKKNQKKE
jgi:17beta-estradiol 17-dehydrogenase / very-long-chain 3-oxoacyl-CoA reductase